MKGNTIGLKKGKIVCWKKEYKQYIKLCGIEPMNEVRLHKRKTVSVKKR